LVRRERQARAGITEADGLADGAAFAASDDHDNVADIP
jgi:hypothetical protein